MNSKRTILPMMVTLLTTLGLSSTASSATITGQIPVSLTITAACAVNNGGGAGDPWGSLDFGSHTNLISTINSQVTGNGGNGISVSCPVGLTPSLKLNAGANTLNSLRRLAPGTGTYYVPYRLYSDSARSVEIPTTSSTGITIAATGNPVLIPIYASILATDQTVMSPAAGSYTDTVTATVEW